VYGCLIVALGSKPGFDAVMLGGGSAMALANGAMVGKDLCRTPETHSPLAELPLQAKEKKLSLHFGALSTLDQTFQKEENII
jgi:hypothetical protein